MRQVGSMASTISLQEHPSSHALNLTAGVGALTGLSNCFPSSMTNAFFENRLMDKTALFRSLGGLTERNIEYSPFYSEGYRIQRQISSFSRFLQSSQQEYLDPLASAASAALRDEIDAQALF